MQTRLLLGLVALATVALALPEPAVAEEKRHVIYEAPQSLGYVMNVEAARHMVRTGLNHWSWFVEPPDGKLWTVSDVDISPSSLALVYDKKKRLAVTVPLADVAARVVYVNVSPGDDRLELETTSGTVFAHNRSRKKDDPSFQVVKNGPTLRMLADALLILKRGADVADPAGDARFAEVVRSYHASAVKPVLPESARRYRVQAEASVRDKEFAAAAALFKQALDAAPWWADGYVNRALVLASVSRYPEAIAEMKRFLLLEPKDPEARKYQDLIYEWELKAK